MNLNALLHRTRRLSLDERYAKLKDAQKHFKPHSADMKELTRQLQNIQLRRIQRDTRKSVA